MKVCVHRKQMCRHSEHLQFLLPGGAYTTREKMMNRIHWGGGLEILFRHFMLWALISLLLGSVQGRLRHQLYGLLKLCAMTMEPLSPKKLARLLT
jgi:hypothetical protein